MRTKGCRNALVLVGLLSTLACDDGVGPDLAEGPPPSVSLVVDRAEIPAMARLLINPPGGSHGWRYAVHLDLGDIPQHVGVADRGVSIPLTYSIPGVHRLRVVLSSPSRDVVVERALLAIDPEAAPGVPVLSRRLIETRQDALPFEGITIDPAGTRLYVATYRGGEVFQLDAESLEPLSSVVLRYGVEGLAVSPSGDVLFAIHKNFGGLDVVDIPSMRLRGNSASVYGFFVVALEQNKVLAGGDGRLALYNAVADSILAILHDSSGVLRARHFAISPDGPRVAVAHPYAAPSNGVLIADIATLTAQRMYEFPGLGPDYVAYSPDGGILYVLASGHLLVVDVRSGEVLQDYDLGPRGCSVLCVANPVATSHDGRWVVFAQETRAIFVDTTLHVPFIAGPLGSGVVASPVRDEFTFVDGAGVVTRVGPPEIDAD
jgi:hypothetical protein